MLRVHLVSYGQGAQRNAEDHPVPVASIHCPVGVPGLVRAVEGADAEMDDADSLRRAVISEALDGGRQPVKGAGGQSHSR